MRIRMPNDGYIALQPGVNTAEKVTQVMAEVIRECAAKDHRTEWLYNFINERSSSEKDFIYRMANLCFKLAYFEPDPPTTQIIKTPSAVIRTERANCVDYTVLLGALAAYGGLHVIIRAVQLPGQATLGHVYPIINGLPIDLVQGQDQSGQEYLTRSQDARPSIGTELEYLRNFDTLV